MKTILSVLIAGVAAMGAFAQTPKLNSYSAAQATVFLDFDGHYVQGTAWNWSGPIQALPSGLSSSAANFRINATPNSIGAGNNGANLDIQVSLVNQYADTKAFRLQSNMVRNTISITTSEAYSYQLLDETGRLLQRGKLQPGANQLNIQSGQKGLLLLQVQGENETWCEKLIKQ